VEQYGDQIRIVYRDFPLTSIHPDAQKAAEAGECADEQGRFWEMHDLIYANQVIGLSVDALVSYAGQVDGLDTEELRECVESGKYAEEVAADLRDGSTYGVSGTPTFFINGYRLVGAQPLAAFTALIDQELQNN
jgi:protein-disulfide isomerase